MNKRWFVFFLSLFAYSTFAQKVEFMEEEFEFGNIKEIDGIAEHDFSFKNTGDVPVYIQNVKASCGCTSTGWSRDTIMPGDTGYVRAAFNPFNRPGDFQKSLHVTFSDPLLSKDLKFKGFVIAKQATINEEFPFRSGNLRFTGKTINLGRVTKSGPVNAKITLYNQSKSPVRLLKIKAPEYILLEMPEMIEAEQKSELHLSYSAEKKKEFGPVTDEITLITDDPVQPEKNIVLMADLTDLIVDSANADITKLPQLVLQESGIQYDTIVSGDMAYRELEIKNNGKQDLIIHRAISNADYIKALVEKKILKPGQKTKIKITYNSSGMVGMDAKVLRIYSNDPVSPVSEVSVRAIVKRPNN